MTPFQEDPQQDDGTAAKQALMTAGDEAYDAGEFALALDRYHRACLLDRSDPRVWCALGMTYYSLDFNREAWRSYLLALMCAPSDPDTLWYCAEFMAGVGGTELARIFIEKYLVVEAEPERLDEARELLATLPAAPADGQLSENERAAAASLLAGEAQSPASEPGGLGFDDEGNPQVQRQDDSGGSAENEAEDAATEERSAQAEEYSEAPEGAFIANMALQLEGAGATCQHCHTGIPLDAPYCYACLMPHFYEEV